MIPRRFATLLLAGALAASAAPALAQGAAEPAPKKAHPKRPAKPAARAAVAPMARSPLPGSSGEDEAASLERRRRAFFAPKPDEGATEEPERPSAGVTLGGSGGITPGMGFKF